MDAGSKLKLEMGMGDSKFNSVELVGKYNRCKIFAVVDSGVTGQLIALLNQKSIEGSKIRVMPDCHQGKGCVIGTTMTIKNKVIPNLVGVDIGCGVICIKLAEKRIELPKIDSIIYKKIPSGFNIRNKEYKYCNDIDLSELKCAKSVDIDRAYKSIGSLGGGNHYIEVDEDEEGKKYLVVHTGSRNLGKQIAEYYQEQAWRSLDRHKLDGKIKNKIKELQEAGRELEIDDAIKKLKSTVEMVPHELAYCEGQLFDNYIHDMKIVQRYACLNRLAITDIIIKEMKLHEDKVLDTIHNYIDTDNMILRKGAVSAKKGEELIIPMNMRDGSLICIGKGNDDWNQSAPHGAGRLMSRSQARQSLTVSEFKKTMKEAGIYSTSVGSSTLDESPMAYKPMEEIMNSIQDTVEIVKTIKPIYNFKAGGE